MPLYEYQCHDCAMTFERIQKFSDPPVAVCPSCGGQVKKLLSSPAIQFKGSGWYITDYAKKGAAGKEGKDATKDAGKDAGTGTKDTATSAGGDSGSAGTTAGQPASSGGTASSKSAAPKSD